MYELQITIFTLSATVNLPNCLSKWTIVFQQVIFVNR